MRPVDRDSTVGLERTTEQRVEFFAFISTRRRTAMEIREISTNPRHFVQGAIFATALATFVSVAHADVLKVLSDSPLQPALTKVAGLFEEQTQDQVKLVFDPSPVVKKRIEEGEAADVLIVQPGFVDELSRLGKISGGDRPMIGRVGVGLGERISSPSYDVSTPQRLKETLLKADMVVFNNVASGNTFANALEKLGIDQTLKARIVRTSPNGIFEPVLNGKGNDFVAGTMPLIATTPGIKLLGPLPGDLQNYLVYTAVVMAGTSQRETAANFIKFLTSARAKASFAANGVN
jgi:molybdate transport system substrate-binding protein